MTIDRTAADSMARSSASKHTSGVADRARQVMPGGNTRSTVFVDPHPPYAVSGAGAWITDDSGHRVLDANGNYTALIHGHARHEIVEAVTATLANGSAFGLPTMSEVELAEVLQARTGQDHWRFCNSGTEAVMMLLRAARACTRRPKIIRFRGSYHGTSPDVVGNESHDQVIVVEQGDHAAVAAALRAHEGEVAGVLIDLMPNRAGLHPAAPEHVAELRRLTTEAGALLLVDEVITFRLGVAGLSEEYGIKPDLVSLGKAIGGGFAVGAIGGSKENLTAFDPRLPHLPGAVSWGGTFSANPVSMAAGKVALELFDDAAVQALNRTGDRIREQLAADGIPVAGRGSLIRLGVKDTTSAWWALYRRGVLAGTNGLLAISTAMSDSDIDHLLGAVHDTFRFNPELAT